MHDTDKKNVLFWCLVFIIFFIVFLFWLPNFIMSVQTFVQSVGSTSNEKTNALRDELAPQIEEVKKSFDALLKQIPVEDTSAQNQREQTTEPAANK